MWQGVGGIWQGVGTCGRGGGRVWGHVGGGQAYGIDGDMWHGWRHVAGCGSMWQDVGACGRVWGHVAEVVAGSGGTCRG